MNEPAEEKWADIIGYEGLYQVSNIGNVKSLQGWNGREYIHREKMLQKTFTTTGYYKVKLCNRKSRVDGKVHRLVATAFIPNPYNLPYVNHKDGNKLNNHVENLEWCTQMENVIHAYTTGLMKVPYINNEELKSLYIDERKSISELSEIFGVTRKTLRDRLKRLGITRRTNGEQNNKYQIPMDELLTDFRQGMKNVDLARKYACSTQIIAVRKYQFRKRGIL